MKQRFLLLLVLCLTVSGAWADAPSKLKSGDTWDEDTKTLTVNSNTANSYYLRQTEIVHLVINPGVEYLAEDCFSHCSNLQDVTFAEGATLSWIDLEAFEDCTALKSITIPASVTNIGKSAFYGCTALKSVIFATGSNLETIKEGTFRGCTALKSITIPASVTDIASNAFRGCTSLPAILVDEDNEKYSSEDGVLFNKAKTTLVLYPAGKSETSYTVPSGVTTIGKEAFYGIANLTAVTIPDGVTTIGMDAFTNTGWYNSQANGPLYLCGWLLGYKGDEPAAPYTLEIEAGTKRIAEYALSCFKKLSSVTIPASVTTICMDAFGGCTALESVTFADGSKLETIGALAFEDCIALENITIPASVTTIGAGAFSECTALKNVTFADGSKLEVIGDGAFYGCTALTNITIPASVTSIEYGAFGYCENLATVTLNSNPYIGYYAFDKDDDGNIPAVTMNLTGNEGATGEYWTTFYNENYNFQVPAEGTQVFKAALSGSTLALTELTTDKIVNAGNAVILKSTASSISLTLTTTNSSNDFTCNSLLGVNDPNGLTADDPSTTFVLNKKNDVVGFYKLKAGKKAGVGKAYLTYSGALTKEFFGFEEEDATRIANVNDNVNDNCYYDLQGRCVSNGQSLKKGLYIVNGKKVFIK